MQKLDAGREGAGIVSLLREEACNLRPRKVASKQVGAVDIEKHPGFPSCQKLDAHPVIVELVARCAQRVGQVALMVPCGDYARLALAEPTDRLVAADEQASRLDAGERGRAMVHQFSLEQLHVFALVHGNAPFVRFPRR